MLKRLRWNTARHDFAELAPTNGHRDASLPRVRLTLLEQLVEALVPLDVLDRFQVRGVFVNWWEGIKYDLKTITSLGWAPTLIPEPLVVNRFFSVESEALAEQDKQILEAESLVADAVENARMVLEYEPEEDETVSAATVRALLADAINEGENGEVASLTEAAGRLKQAETILKQRRTERDRLDAELRLKIELKLYGPDDRIEETKALLNAAVCELAALGGSPVEASRRTKGHPSLTQVQKESIKRRKALVADISTLTGRIETYEQLMKQIEGVITTSQARELILQKHHNLVAEYLQRYMGAEERVLIATIKMLFEKYFTSAELLQEQQANTIKRIRELVTILGYS